MCVSLFLWPLWLIAAPVAWANGQTTHLWITGQAVEALEEGPLRTLLADPQWMPMLRNGTMFPDGGYAVGHEYGEVAHWEPFQDLFRDWILAEFGDPTSVEAAPYVAFYMGMASHGMADQHFDSLYMERSKVYDAALGWAEGQSLDVATDVVFAGLKGGDEAPEAWMPEDLPQLFAQMGVTVDQETLDQGQEDLGLAIGLVALAGQSESSVAEQELLFPWGCSHLDDGDVPGSPPNEAVVVARYWEALWADLTEQAPPLSVLETIPSDGAVGHARFASDVEARVSVVFSRSMEDETAINELVQAEDEFGEQIAVQTDLFYWDDSHVLLISPQGHWTRDAQHTVTLSERLVSVDGHELEGGAEFSFSTSPQMEPVSDAQSAEAACGCRTGGSRMFAAAWIWFVGLMVAARSRRRSFIVGAGVLLGGCSADSPIPSRPDVLLVVEDTVRADALSAYGHNRPTSPQLEAVAAAGVRFADVTAPGSWTWPVHATLFTGLMPWEHGAHFADPNGAQTMQLTPMPFLVTMPRDDVPTLAERFRDAGYRTVSVSGNVLIGPDLPQMMRGFDVAAHHLSDGEVVRAAVETMKDNDERPLFLFVNLFGAHGPYDVHPVRWLDDNAKTMLSKQTAPAWVQPFLTDSGVDLHRHVDETGTAGTTAFVAGDHAIPAEGLALLRDLYDGEVAQVDRHLNALLTGWNAAGREDGVVAVTSDHGEYFGEHGLLAHGRTVYPEVTRVPLAIAAPERLPAGVVVDVPVELGMLHDTLLVLAGLDAKSEGLLPVVSNPSAGPTVVRSAAWSDHYWASAVGGRFLRGFYTERRGDWIALVDTDGAVEAFNLDADPGMNKPVVDGTGPVWISDVRFPASIATDPLAIDDKVHEELQALGYVGE